MFPTVGRRQAGRVQPGGLEPLSARERAEGHAGNDRGPMEGKSEASAAGPAAATQC